MKMDCVPGKLNFIVNSVVSNGLVNSFCYELCGNGHSSMLFNVLFF